MIVKMIVFFNLLINKKMEWCFDRFKCNYNHCLNELKGGVMR